jgi:selenocysteine lyase/cysteine desulfurase
LHKYGAYAFFDYAGVGAYVEVDMQGKSEGIDDGSLDAAYFSPHKMVGGPGSSGILVARNKLFEKAFDVETNQASTPAGGTIEIVTRNTHTYSKDIEYREDSGTPGILQDIRSGLAFKVKEMVGCQNIEKLEHIHCSLALNAWTPNPYIALMGADRMSYHFATRRVSIFSFNILSSVPAVPPTKSRGGYLQGIVLSSLNDLANVGSFIEKENLYMMPLHFNFVIALLNDLYGIQGRGGCSCAGPYGFGDLLQIDDKKVDFDTVSQFPASKPGWARVNLNYFISKHEVTFITEAVNQIAKYGWMLLPQYVQDTQSGRYIHHTLIDNDGNEKKTHPPSSSSSKNDVLFSRSLHDLRFEQILQNEGSQNSQSNQMMKASIPEVKYETIDRPRSSYFKVLREAMKLYKKEADRTIKRTHVRNFTSSSLAKVSMNKEEMNKSIWWLLPTQAEEILLVGAGENTHDLAQQ